MSQSGVLQSALRKAQWRLIPLLSVCYLAAFMDRANISFAAESMNRDLHFAPAMYGLGAGLFFVSYALFEIPSNYGLLRFGARRWMARIMLTWGLLAAAMMFVRTPASFYTTRLLLGAAEAGFFPGVVFYLAQWFPASHRARAVSLFYVAFPMANFVMGGLAGALLRLNGRMGLSGWQWLFLVEGMPAVVLSVAVWFLLPDAPASAKWLTPEEVAALESAVRQGAAGDHASASTAPDVRDVLRNGTVWLYGLFYFLTLGSFYAMNFFLPLLLRGLTTWTPERVGYLIAATGVVSGAAMVVNGRDSDLRRERLWHILVPLGVMAVALPAVGLCMRFGGPATLAVTALLLVSVAYSAMQGPVLAGASRVAPGAMAAIAIALLNSLGNVGGFVGPYFSGWMREWTGGYAVGVGVLCVPVAAAGFCMVALVRRLGPEVQGAGHGE